MLLVFAAVLLVSGCGGQQAADPEPATPSEQPVDNSWDKVVEAGQIVAGLDDNYPPMGYHDENGELIGFDIDMGKEISERLGVEIVWQPTAWDGVVASLQAKKFDVIISGMTITPEREEVVNFAGPYIYAAQGVCVQAGNETIVTNDDLEGKVIGTQAGSTAFHIAEELLADGVLEEIKQYPDFTNAFQDLKVGRTDAVLADDYVIAGYLKNMPGEFKMTGELFNEETNGIAVRKDDVELYEKLNGAIEEMILDGTMAELGEKWLGGDQSARLLEMLQAEGK